MRDETTETIDTLVDVRQAMTLLTERQRQALTLWSQGYTQEEIAERLGCCHQRVSQLITESVDAMNPLVN